MPLQSKACFLCQCGLHWHIQCISFALVPGYTDHVLGARCNPHLGPSLGVMVAIRSIFLLLLSDQGPDDQEYQAMIAALLVLSLMTLLVATDPEPVGSSVHSNPDAPFRPDRKPIDEEIPKPDRLAA